MMKKEKPMMSVTAIIQGAQHWGRTLAGFSSPRVSLGKTKKLFLPYLLSRFDHDDDDGILFLFL